MSVVCEYKTLKALSSEMLEKAVNKLLQEGWQTFGEPLEFIEEDFSFVGQGMVKYQT